MPTLVTYLRARYFHRNLKPRSWSKVGFLLFETESPKAWAGTKLAMHPRMIFKPDPSKCWNNGYMLPNLVQMSFLVSISQVAPGSILPLREGTVILAFPAPSLQIVLKHKVNSIAQKLWWPVTVAHVFTPELGRQRQSDLSESEASLFYILISGQSGLHILIFPNCPGNYNGTKIAKLNPSSKATSKLDKVSPRNYTLGISRDASYRTCTAFMKKEVEERQGGM